MTRLITAELVKGFTVRSTLGLILGAAGVAVLGAFATLASRRGADLVGALHELDFFVIASFNVALFALIAGTRIVTDDFRYGSIVPTFLLAPARGRVLTAKAVAGWGTAVLLATLAQAVMFAFAILMLNAKSATAAPTERDFLAFAGLVAAGGFWGVIGVAVGTIVRHQVPAMVGGVLWILVAENLGPALLGATAKFLPGQAGLALSSTSAGTDTLAVPAAVGVLTAWAAGALLVAATVLKRRDVVVA